MLPAAVVLSLKLVEDKIEQLIKMRKFSVANSPQFDVEISWLILYFYRFSHQNTHCLSIATQQHCENLATKYATSMKRVAGNQKFCSCKHSCCV